MFFCVFVLLLCCVDGLPNLSCCCIVDLLAHVFVCLRLLVCLLACVIMSLVV